MIRVLAFYEVGAPNDGRWGVYGVALPDRMRIREDFVRRFRSILPQIKALYDRIQRKA